MPSPARVRVLVVDDSALIRSLLRSIIDAAPDMTCVGVAPDPIVAREMIRNLNPDVLTLDVEMPKMDGLDFLEKLMRLRPMPVVMVSGHTAKGSEVSLRALELGAVEIVTKPRLDLTAGLEGAAEEIRDKIRAASMARIRPRQASTLPPASTPISPTTTSTRAVAADRLIAIGASTGGTEAIKAVLMAMPASAPGVVITQHMPERFTKSFAERLDRVSALTVTEAVHGERILNGHAYIAPGHSHLRIARSGGAYVADLSTEPPVNRHRPSVDVLFNSVAAVAGKQAVGALLTGMGKDGALGLLAMRKAGAFTIAQNEATCVVYGMPREAVLVGGAAEELALERIAPRLIETSRMTSPGGSR